MDTDNAPSNTIQSAPASPAGKHRFKVLIPAVLLIFAGVGGLMLTRTWQETSEPPSSVTMNVSESEEISEIEVQITKDGFYPDTITINKGTKVTWVNADSSPHRIASNPYPDHTELPSLDSKQALGPETTYTYTFNEPGAFGYHDHYRPTINGTVIVE